MIIWNPWHGCHKVSEGCQHCYIYFFDGKRGIDTSKVYRTDNFNLTVQRRRDGRYKLPSGMQLYVGLSTDFFVEEADCGSRMTCNGCSNCGNCDKDFEYS